MNLCNLYQYLHDKVHFTMVTFYSHIIQCVGAHVPDILIFVILQTCIASSFNGLDNYPTLNHS